MRRVAVLAGLVIHGCGWFGRDAAVDAVEAEKAVRDLFAAAEAGDCARIRPLLPKLATEEACQEFLGDVREHQLRLVDVNRVVVDGRDPDAYIVRTQVSRSGTEKEMLVRAERTDGGWIVVF